MKPITEAAFAKALRELAERAGIRRRIRPYSLRHTRMTDLARVLTEQELKLVAGWVKDSKMARRYVHLSGRDALAAVLRAEGLSREEGEAREPLLPSRRCPRCGATNAPEARYCSRCGWCLSEEAAFEALRAKEELEALLDALLADPVVREAIRKALKRMMGEGGRA